MSSNNGDSKLQEALTNLLNIQIKLSERQAETDNKIIELKIETDKQTTEAKKEWLEMKKEHDREWLEQRKEMIALRRDMDRMIDVLNKHTQLLEDLPTAVKEKVGLIR